MDLGTIKISNIKPDASGNDRDLAAQNASQFNFVHELAKKTSVKPRSDNESNAVKQPEDHDSPRTEARIGRKEARATKAKEDAQAKDTNINAQNVADQDAEEKSLTDATKDSAPTTDGMIPTIANSIAIITHPVATVIANDINLQTTNEAIVSASIDSNIAVGGTEKNGIIPQDMSSILPASIANENPVSVGLANGLSSAADTEDATALAATGQTAIVPSELETAFKASDSKTGSQANALKLLAQTADQDSIESLDDVSASKAETMIENIANNLKLNSDNKSAAIKNTIAAKDLSPAEIKSADGLSETPAAESPLPPVTTPTKDAAGVPLADKSEPTIGGKAAKPTIADMADKIAGKAKMESAAADQANNTNANGPQLTSLAAPIVTSNTEAANFKVVAPAYANAQPLPAEQVAFQIIKSAKDGINKIKIQLTPDDLGRVEIHLDMHKDSLIKAVIASDKPETAQWLMRDAKQLERALQDAGIKFDSGSLQFENRGQQFDQSSAQQFMNSQNDNQSAKYYGGKNNMAGLDIDHSALIQQVYVANDGVNIMV